MADINSKSAAYSIRIPLSDFKELQKAEKEGLNYRKLTNLAIRNFIESGAINRLSTEKAV